MSSVVVNETKQVLALSYKILLILLGVNSSCRFLPLV